MDEEVRMEKEAEDFEKEKAERESRDAEKTRKNREKREKLKARRGKGGKAAAGEGREFKEEKVGGMKGPRVSMPQSGEQTSGSGEVMGSVPEVGLIIHDDD